MKSDFRFTLKQSVSCFNVDLKSRFHFEFGNTERTLVECEFVMVEVVDVIEVKIELET